MNISYAQFPMPNAQFPIPNAQCPIPSKITWHCRKLQVKNND
ncbi:MAG: hypothetical protein ACHBN1_03250 [Heteroscytonema crispum UTEX LB 1556]